MPSWPEHIEDTALSRLFVGAKASPDVAWFTLPGGRILFHAGETPDRLYFLMAGRLGVVQRAEGQAPQFLGVIRPGQPAGEMAMIAGTDHTATVVALRDSELLALPRQAFLAGVDRNPAVMGELARLMVLRARRHGRRGGGRARPCSASSACAPRPRCASWSRRWRRTSPRAATPWPSPARRRRSSRPNGSPTSRTPTTSCSTPPSTTSRAGRKSSAARSTACSASAAAT
ncbi:MAG: cyclic nucleotide-binding domain-containing protein [Caulobacteraceae bacterium]